MEEDHKPVRLQKLLASWGLASRRTIEDWMLARRITVDGKLADKPGIKVLPGECHIAVDGKIVTAPTNAFPVVFAFYKPLLVISSLKDPQGRKTICNFLRSDSPRVYPVGRLDYDSTGLLLLTNNGDLTNRLLHPKFKVEKEYQATIRKSPLTKAELENFRSGLLLDDGLTAPCQITFVGGLTYNVILKEGRNRQVRRMFSALGHEVVKLHRVRFGPIKIGNQQVGSLRKLLQSEIDLLDQGKR